MEPDHKTNPPGEKAAPGRKRGSEILAGIKHGLLVGLVIAVPFAYVATRDKAAPATELSAAASGSSAATLRQADFGERHAPDEARQLANWVARSGDAQGGPFVIVDKKNTHVYVFDREAVLQGDSPVLLGGARGDDSVDGIGGRTLAQIREDERTTPAGRFVGEPGRNLQGEDIIWVDYDTALSMHRVRTGNAKEKRLERLATPTTADNRISYGCINVPVAFYEQQVKPVFTQRRAVIYVLPEEKALGQVFTALGGGAPATATHTARL